MRSRRRRSGAAPSGLACPTHVLFNGGVMKAGGAPRPRRRRAERAGWCRKASTALDARHVLEAPDLDHAVARGAAYYGLARRGRGIRIRSGAARTYYVGIESAMPAVPGHAGAAQGALRRAVRDGGRDRRASIAPLRVRADRRRARRSSGFFSSTVRKNDPVGAMIEDWGDDLEELSSLDVTLQVDGREGADRAR